MLATQHPMENSLRWLRRSIVIILLLANFMAVILADTGMKRHITTIQSSSIQARIDDIAARFASH
jgi:hypothetical protein